MLTDSRISAAECRTESRISNTECQTVIRKFNSECQFPEILMLSIRVQNV
jgi:hypothetical protein